MSNFPTGFDGFQARMEAAIEACGGDHIARMHCEREFAAAIARQVRKGRDRPHKCPGPHRGEWLAATAEQFDRAAQDAERRCVLADPPPMNGERFKLLWGKETMVRATSRGAVILATRRGLHASLTDTGYALASMNGHTHRSHHRTFRSEEGAAAFFPRLAEQFVDLSPDGAA